MFVPHRHESEGVHVRLTAPNEAPPPPAKRSRIADDDGSSSRQVVSNPANGPPPPATLKEAADVVVRCLDPFYKQGKFATKVGRGAAPGGPAQPRETMLKLFWVLFQDLFKSFARYLSHLLAGGRSQGRGQGKRRSESQRVTSGGAL